MCDRLACRAYGFANSGYVSAAAHWDAMLTGGQAHPADRCPPVGSFMFWTTGTPLGHVALVVENDGSCSPDRIKVVSNDVLDGATGDSGGVYLVTLRQIESGAPVYRTCR
jgi:surface antigen